MHIDPGSISSRLSGLLASPKLNNLNGGPPRGNTAASSLRSGDDIFFSSRSKSLGQLGSLLGKLGAAVRNIGTTPDQLRAARKDITGIEASIQSALGRDGEPELGFETQWISGAVNSFTISQLDLQPGEELEVDVQVTQSARQGGMYLSLGGSNLDLGGSLDVTSSFQIRISGIFGTRQLTFASGQTMTQIAAAINTFSDQIGVEAIPSSSGNTGGITLRTAQYGAAEFVSVQILNSGSIGSSSNIGIYNMSNQDADEVDPSSHVDFNSTHAQLGYEQVGRDVRGRINGVLASGYGTRLYSAMPTFAVSIDLATGDLRSNQDANAQNLGRFVAMRFAGIPRDQNSVGPGEDSGWPIAR